MSMVQYDPQIIQQFAERLYKRARGIVGTFVVLGAIIGAIIGKIVSGVLGGVDGDWIIMLLAAVFLGVIGYSLGMQAAFRIKLEAQTALCQVRIEENTKKSLSEHTQRRSVQAPLVK